MSDDPAPTGGLDAILLDALLSLDIDADEAVALSFEQGMARLRAAAGDGDLPAERVDALRDAGLPL